MIDRDVAEMRSTANVRNTRTRCVDELPVLAVLRMVSMSLLVANDVRQPLVEREHPHAESCEYVAVSGFSYDCVAVVCIHRFLGSGSSSGLLLRTREAANKHEQTGAAADSIKKCTQRSILQIIGSWLQASSRSLAGSR